MCTCIEFKIHFPQKKYTENFTGLAIAAYLLAKNSTLKS